MYHNELRACIDRHLTVVTRTVWHAFHDRIGSGVCDGTSTGSGHDHDDNNSNDGDLEPMSMGMSGVGSDLASIICQYVHSPQPIIMVNECA